MKPGRSDGVPRTRATGQPCGGRREGGGERESHGPALWECVWGPLRLIVYQDLSQDSVIAGLHGNHGLVRLDLTQSVSRGNLLTCENRVPINTCSNERPTGPTATDKSSFTMRCRLRITWTGMKACLTIIINTVI